jgi:tripartite-type tricarboxylate transporter receptor subunit TctC
MRNLSSAAAAMGLLLAVGLPAVASAQETYPSQPIRFIVPFSPGGSTDIVARLIGEELSERVGQPVVVENRPGAGGNIGADEVANAEPDGYTMLMGTTGVMSINESLYPELSYNAAEDFAPVAHVASLTNVLAVSPDVPADSVEELIAYAKENPGELTFASSGVGAATHLVGELFKSATDTDIVHIPYKGSGQAMTDLLSGNVSMMFDQIASSVSNIKAGKLKALGVTSSERSEALPEVPTIAEAGVPGFEALSWSGVVVPAGTPQPVIDRLNQEINAILETPEMQARFAELGADTVGGSPEDFAEHIAAEREKWSKVIEEADIRIE